MRGWLLEEDQLVQIILTILVVITLTFTNADFDALAARRALENVVGHNPGERSDFSLLAVHTNSDEGSLHEKYLKLHEECFYISKRMKCI
jgi:hypothetical protein